LIIASAVAGLVSLTGFLVGLSDPVYYSPETSIDYLAAVLNTAGPFAAAVALLIWWKVTPVRRGAILILAAATAAFALGLGNLLEDIVGLEWAGDLFFYGGFAMFATTALAGLMALTVNERWRWSGLFLLAIAAGLGFDSALIWGVAWLALAVAVWRVSERSEGPA